MRFSILAFIILLIGCSSNSRSIKVEDMCVFDTVSENHINKDSLVFSFLDSDATFFGLDLFIENFNLKSKQVKVLVDNFYNDTLMCVNVVYQKKDHDVWGKIPCDFEDVGMIIFPKQKVHFTYGLPNEYDFVVGMYKIIFSFTNSRNKCYDVSAYFDVNRK